MWIWEGLEKIIHNHHIDITGTSVFKGAKVLLRQLELKYISTKMEGKEIRIPSHIRFNGKAITEDKSFKFTTEWIGIDDNELESVQTMILETIEYIKGRRAQENLFDE